MQDTFFIIHKKADTLRAETLIAYMQKIAINACYRKRRNTQQTSHPDTAHYIDTQEETDVDFLPEEYLHNKESRNELLSIIMSLPRMQWETIYLYYYASFSVDEIAALQQCSVSNVCKTLRTARQSIKDHLEGKRKRKPGVLPASLGLASLAALLMVEEQVFAAVYIPCAAPCWAASGATAAAVTGTAAASAPVAGYVAALCTLAVVAVSAVAYYTLAFESAEDNEATPKTTAQYIIEEELSVQQPEISEQVLIIDEPPIPISEPTEPEPEIPAPTTPATPPPTTIPPATAPATPPPTTPPPTEPEPTPTDRTAQIMAALAAANTGEAVARIIEYYGFAHERYLRGDGERFYFYTHNEGSGYILIGNATTENNDWQRMQFALFYSEAVPSDVIDLIIFMERD